MRNELLAQYCSPVLANIKPSNLFSISNTLYNVDNLVEAWNKDFNKYDIYFKVLVKRKNTSSVICFKKDLLTDCINTNNNNCFLESCGYNTDNADTCINCLMKRILKNEFPHEIGVILGYPYEDVIGFIENKGQNYLYKGYWKVYENIEERCKLFNLYNENRRIYALAKDNESEFIKLVEHSLS